MMIMKLLYSIFQCIFDIGSQYNLIYVVNSWKYYGLEHGINQKTQEFFFSHTKQSEVKFTKLIMHKMIKYLKNYTLIIRSNMFLVAFQMY